MASLSDQKFPVMKKERNEISFFFNLEKRNKAKTHIKILIDNENNAVTDQSAILNH